MGELNSGQPRCKICDGKKVFKPLFNLGVWECDYCKAHPPTSDSMFLFEVRRFVVKQHKVIMDAFYGWPQNPPHPPMASSAVDVLIWRDVLDSAMIVVKIVMHTRWDALELYADVMWNAIIQEFNPITSPPYIDSKKLTILVEDSTKKSFTYNYHAYYNVP